MITFTYEDGSTETVEIIDKNKLDECCDKTIAIKTDMDTISEAMFIGFNKLQEVVFTAETTINNSAFSMCTSLKLVHFADKVNLSRFAFMGCCNLQTLRVDPTKMTIKWMTNKYCLNFLQVEVKPENLYYLCKSINVKDL